MHKLKALLIALCLVLALVVLNIPQINYGEGSGSSYMFGYEEPD